MVNITIKIEPITLNTGPYGFYLFAQDYFKVAELAAKLDTKKRINYPAYFLYTRSFELIMKSILLASGIVSIKKIKSDYKHDLDKIIKGFTPDLKKIILLTKTDEAILLLLNKWYKTTEKKFEYYDLITSGIINIEKTDYPILPNLKVLQSLGEKMINLEVKKYILSKS
jgi:hypothetical protein